MATAPTLTLAGVFSYVEGNSGSRSLSIPVTRSGDLSKTSSCQWKVVGDTDAADYVGPVSGTLSWAARSGLARISLAIRGDTAYEADETSRIELSGLVNCTLQTNTVQIVIRNDDKATAPAPSPPAPVTTEPTPTPTPTPTPAPAPVPAPPAPISSAQPPADIAALLQAAPSFDAVFTDGQSFPSGPWETKWWGNWDANDPTTGDRGQYGISLAMYCDKTMGVDPFQVQNGVLQIITDRLPSPPPLGWKGGYSTGLLMNRSSKQMFGYFEASVWAPMVAGKAMGLWPTAWLISETGGQELDLIEVQGSKPNVNVQTIHGFPKAGGGSVARGTWNMAADITKGYVTYGALWHPDGYVQFFVNGQKTNREDVSDLNWSQPMFLMVSNAIGASPPLDPMFGPPDANTVLPAPMYVNGLRAWAMK